MLGLFFLRQFGKTCLGFHEPSHKGGGMGFHDRCKQRFLAGKVAVESSGGHTGMFYDLAQGSTKESFF